MRNVAVFLAVVAWSTVLVAQTKQADQAPPAETVQVCTLNVSGMTCGGCAAAVKRAAKKVDGVKDAKVSYEKGLAEVTFDPTKTSPEAIAKAITEKSGFQTEAPKAEASKKDKNDAQAVALAQVAPPAGQPVATVTIVGDTDANKSLAWL